MAQKLDLDHQPDQNCLKPPPKVFFGKLLNPFLEILRNFRRLHFLLKPSIPPDQVVLDSSTARELNASLLGGGRASISQKLDFKK